MIIFESSKAGIPWLHILAVQMDHKDFKPKRTTKNEALLGRKDDFTSLLTVFGKSLVQHSARHGSLGGDGRLVSPPRTNEKPPGSTSTSPIGPLRM